MLSVIQVHPVFSCDVGGGRSMLDHDTPARQPQIAGPLKKPHRSSDRISPDPRARYSAEGDSKCFAVLGTNR
jgi:hypothetical protein